MTSGGDGTGRRRRRPLNPEERALWEHVTSSVTQMRPAPKRKTKLDAKAAEPPEPAVVEEKPAKVAKVRAAPVAPPPKPPGPPPLAPLEPKMRRRLSRGAEVDARLDLHGLTQAAAHARLHGFLRGAQGSGYSLVLVITGKGTTGTGDAGFSMSGQGRGVLRRLVPQWLSAPDMRTIVVGFETASRTHGGEGALYVRVRRIRGGDL